jgi:hypothetical protein
MAKKAAQKRDGVYTRKDRAGLWISWTDVPLSPLFLKARHHRHHQKTDR